MSIPREKEKEEVRGKSRCRGTFTIVGSLGDSPTDHNTVLLQNHKPFSFFHTLCQRGFGQTGVPVHCELRHIFVDK